MQIKRYIKKKNKTTKQNQSTKQKTNPENMQQTPLKFAIVIGVEHGQSWKFNQNKPKRIMKTPAIDTMGLQKE